MAIWLACPKDNFGCYMKNNLGWKVREQGNLYEGGHNNPERGLRQFRPWWEKSAQREVKQMAWQLTPALTVAWFLPEFPFLWVAIFIIQNFSPFTKWIMPCLNGWCPVNMQSHMFKTLVNWVPTAHSSSHQKRCFSNPFFHGLFEKMPFVKAHTYM